MIEIRLGGERLKLEEEWRSDSPDSTLADFLNSLTTTFELGPSSGDPRQAILRNVLLRFPSTIVLHNNEKVSYDKRVDY